MADVTDTGIVISPAGCDGAFDRPLGRLAGLIGRWDDADATSRRAELSRNDSQAPPLVARTDIHHAEVLLRAGRTGDRGRADHLLASAHTTATRLDMHDLVHEVEHPRNPFEPCVGDSGSADIRGCDGSGAECSERSHLR